jgi:hypothetical protein
MLTTRDRWSGPALQVVAGFAVAILAASGGARSALAVSGEVPASVGAYSAAANVCQSLRTKTDAQGTSVQGDVLFACDPAGEACEIDLPGNTTNREARSGIAATGFCADSFPQQGPTITPSGLVEADVVVHGSSFSGITGVKPPGDALAEADNIICTTFALPGTFRVGTGASRRDYGPGVRVCRKIVACTGPDCSSPATCPGEQTKYFVTIRDSCADIQALVTGSVAPTAPDFAFALFTDVDTTTGGSVSRPGRQALFVCPGYQAQCVNAANRAQTSTVIDYRVPTGDVQTGYCRTDSKGTLKCY